MKGESSRTVSVCPSVGASATASTVTDKVTGVPSLAAVVTVVLPVTFAMSRDHGVTTSAKSPSLSDGRPTRLRFPTALETVTFEPPAKDVVPFDSVAPDGKPEMTTQADSPGAPGVNVRPSARPPSAIEDPLGLSAPRSSRRTSAFVVAESAGTSDTGVTLMKRVAVVEAVVPSRASDVVETTVRV